MVGFFAFAQREIRLSTNIVKVDKRKIKKRVELEVKVRLGRGFDVMEHISSKSSCHDFWWSEFHHYSCLFFLEIKLVDVVHYAPSS